MNIALLAKESGPARELAAEVSSRLSERGFSVSMLERGTAADAVVIIGGDGTLLRAVALMGDRQAPVIGVNMGGLGYLTEVAPGDVYTAIDAFVEGRSTVGRRMMLDVRLLRGGEAVLSCSVLNDAVITKGVLARMAEFETWVDGQFLTRYRADGLILSTPTGSTAYSLSAGGPIIAAALDSILLSPICPHTLTHRPIVLDATSVVELRIPEASDLSLTLDGQTGHPVESGDRIVVSRSTIRAAIVESPALSRYDILRAKLKWGER